MCVLMFHVREIDGAEGQWVAQLCGCEASSPLSACQKTERCQPLCMCLCASPSVCVFEALALVHLCASVVCVSSSVTLTGGQPGQLPKAQHEPSFLSM